MGINSIQPAVHLFAMSGSSLQKGHIDIIILNRCPFGSIGMSRQPRSAHAAHEGQRAETLCGNTQAG